ncbi:MAG TPA: DNA adenine methylase [Acidimicrobiales bacterium]|nr:DNA adenine methylase [Acidimicrobiales bacterium]
MIKYIGSKRRLVPVLGDLLARSGARSALDLFTGTTRVAQEWKRRGVHVTAVDVARYSAVLGGCFIATDALEVDPGALGEVIFHLQNLPGEDGYVTETFSRQARYFQEENARRIDAIRGAIERQWGDHPWRPVLLTSLLLAADRVDSTTGVQMAYLKQWAPRSYQPLELRVPDLIAGTGRAVRGDAVEVAPTLPDVDLAYLDPPYNQHRYAGNYHVWETLIAWDSPEHYGVACKRVGLRGDEGVSVFNRRREAPAAMASLVAGVNAEVVVLSGSDEGWISVDDLADMASGRGAVEVLAFDSRRYIGSQIGVFDPLGKKVGRAGRARNTEFLVVAGPGRVVSRMCAGYPTVTNGGLAG